MTMIKHILSKIINAKLKKGDRFAVVMDRKRSRNPAEYETKEVILKDLSVGYIYFNRYGEQKRTDAGGFKVFQMNLEVSDGKWLYNLVVNENKTMVIDILPLKEYPRRKLENNPYFKKYYKLLNPK